MHSGSHSVLIVEDDADVRGSLAVLLEGEGYRVIEAEHGREALDHLLHGLKVCLILLDLFMPEMNGFAFRARQLEHPELSRIPVVVLSADSAALRRAVSPGVVATMTKPVDLDRLLQLVEEHC